MSRARNWCITINNPIDSDKSQFEEEVVRSRPIKYIVWQIESGENGTPHIQGYVCFSKQLRLNQVKEYFPRAHLEVARGKPEDNKKYCTKEEGRLEGPFEFGEMPEGQGRRSDLKEFKEAVVNEGLCERECLDRFPDIVAKYRDFTRVCIEYGREKRFRSSLPDFQPKEGWQTQLVCELNDVPDRRKVKWYYDEVGNVGKSFFALNYRDREGRFGYVVTGGRHADIYAGYKEEKVIFFDWARDNEDAFPYRVIENFKNGYFLSTKYQVIARRFEPVHVVVFANFAPDQSKLSADRWDIHHILRF
ncbi:Rep [uncultured virus]|uniref:Rep n=1 Tax=uncultured virus TaxID=340016 RepID=A0A2K9LSQ2_9VIRU|nr:Rep [uncultured virus]